MAENASSIPPKGLGTIKLSDFWKSLLLAALSNVLLSLYTIINSGALPNHADLVTMLKTTSAIVISYLLKNLGTNNVGQLLKADKPTIRVDAAQAAADIPKTDTVPLPYNKANQ